MKEELQVIAQDSAIASIAIAGSQCAYYWGKRREAFRFRQFYRYMRQGFPPP